VVLSLSTSALWRSTSEFTVASTYNLWRSISALWRSTSTLDRDSTSDLWRLISAEEAEVRSVLWRSISAL